MMKSGYNPVRRNRNIGTAKQGHGRMNAMTIPLVCNAERIWWENVGPHTEVKRSVGSHEITFLVEHTREDCVHACTVNDIFHVLSLVPASDLESLDTVVMRQSTRKQALVNPAWGRLAYSADFGRPGHKTSRSGPALFLEAANPTRVWKWRKKLCPEDALELERLRNDGHHVEDTGKRFVFRSSLESIRTTQLYRTLFHEIGHWMDWLEKVVRPAGDDSDVYSSLSDRYFARPEQDRELFAHRYADALRKHLTAEGRIPFETMGGALALAGEVPTLTIENTTGRNPL
jgi:hypothetical protein